MAKGVSGIEGKWEKPEVRERKEKDKTKENEKEEKNVTLNLVLPRYFYYISYQEGVTMTPLRKFVIKHSTFIKVVPGDS